MIEMKLASNNVVHTLPENESEALVALLRYMVDAPDSETRMRTVEDARRLLVNDQHRHLRVLLRRGLPLVSLIVALRSHTAFSTFPVNPKELAHFNLFAWGILEPVLNGLHSELTFLSTKLTLPSSVVGLSEPDMADSETTATIRRHLRRVLRGWSSETHPVSEPVYNCVVEAAEKAWNELEMDKFDVGSKSGRYLRAMRTYIQTIGVKVESEIRDWKEEHPDGWGELDEEVATLLPLKLKVLVGSKFLADAHLMPRLPGPLPLLCPSMLMYFISHWTEFPNMLYTVRTAASIQVSTYSRSFV